MTLSLSAQPQNQCSCLRTSTSKQSSKSKWLRPPSLAVLGLAFMHYIGCLGGHNLKLDQIEAEVGGICGDYSERGGPQRPVHLDQQIPESSSRAHWKTSQINKI